MNHSFAPRTSVVLRMLILAAAAGLAGCASFNGKAPHANIVMAASQGWATQPANGYRKLTAAEFDEHVDAMFDEMAAFCANRRPCRVLLFAHGGMNTRSNTLERAEALHQRIKDAGVYPVFLNWNSSFPSSWWDHLARVRKGLWLPKTAVFAPYYFVSDELRAIPEAPQTWYAEVRHAVAGYGPTNSAVRAYADLWRNSATGVKVNSILRADGQSLLDDRTGMERHGAKVFLPLTGPVKLTAAPLIIQPWGTGAWDIMLRRTAMLFRTEAAFRGSPEGSEDADSGAAFGHFLDRFQSDLVPRICSAATATARTPHSDDVVALNSRNTEPPPRCPDRLEVSLVGHSMGAIVANHVLRQAPLLDFANIVHMASAGTVRDYRDTVLPYLRNHPDAQMYHLTLHPQAEVKERGFLDLSPRGSLLVWIDNYFSNPVTPAERTAGRFFNLSKELRFTDEDVRQRVHMKVFRVGQRVACSNPQKHGDFGDFPYWDRAFWDPATPVDANGPVRWNDARCSANAITSIR